MIREQIAGIIYGEQTYQNYKSLPEIRRLADEKIAQIHDKYIAWFQQEVEKLEVLSPEEFEYRLGLTGHEEQNQARKVAQDQLDDSKKKLLEALK